jgi:hypothetical protein
LDDVSQLIRHQKDVMGLDTAQELTRGNPAGVRAMLSQLHPARENATLVANSDDGSVLLGQVTHIINERPAYLTFLMPESAACGAVLIDLLDELVGQAGYLGALNILADAEDNHPAFPCLRRAGFSIYGWQSVWKFPVCAGQREPWQAVTPLDNIAVRNLFQLVVPPLVQSAEPLPSSLPKGFLFRRKGDLAAFARVLTGPRGVFIQPVFHPSAENISDLLCGLRRSFPASSKPVFLAVRSFQAWLEPVLEDLGAESINRRSQLVRYLVNPLLASAQVKQSALVGNR